MAFSNQILVMTVGVGSYRPSHIELSQKAAKKLSNILSIQISSESDKVSEIDAGLCLEIVKTIKDVENSYKMPKEYVPGNILATLKSYGRLLRVLFICTEQSASYIHSIPDYVEIEDFDIKRDTFILKSQDDLVEVYEKATDIFIKLQADEHYRDVKLMADYTGGTKSMVAGLAMAASDSKNVTTTVTTQKRQSNEQNISGAGSTAQTVNFSSIHFRRFLTYDLSQSLTIFDYSSASVKTKNIRRICDSLASLSDLEVLLEAFDQWDRFSHKDSLDCMNRLSNPSKALVDYMLSLKRIISSRQPLDDEYLQFGASIAMKGHGYEIVEDLLNNAFRRAKQDRFDDAVGRLYRALELTAQLTLKLNHEINTKGYNLFEAPLAFRSRYNTEVIENGRIDIGLSRAYELLKDLDDPVGILWACGIAKRSPYASEITNLLKIRNNSLFAHGFKSISRSNWNAMNKVIKEFIGTVIDQRKQSIGFSGLALPQLPMSIDELNWHI